MVDFVFENGEAIDVGSHGTHDYVYADGTPVPDEDVSTIVFEDGTGLGAAGWLERADVLDAATESMGAAYDGKVYVVGGDDGNNEFYFMDMKIYDPATDSWSRGAQMPDTKESGAIGVYNGKLYFAGGEESPSSFDPTVYIYDPATDSWSQGTTRSDDIRNVTNAYSGSNIYMTGGDGKSATYDMASDSWGSLAEPPNIHQNGMGVYADGAFYAFGGGDAGGSLTTNVDAYSGGSWSSKASLPVNDRGVAASIGNGEILIAGLGASGRGTYIYDTATDSYSQVEDTNYGHDKGAVAVVGSTVYAIAGNDDSLGVHAKTERYFFG